MSNGEERDKEEKRNKDRLLRTRLSLFLLSSPPLSPLHPSSPTQQTFFYHGSCIKTFKTTPRLMSELKISKDGGGGDEGVRCDD